MKFQVNRVLNSGRHSGWRLGNSTMGFLSLMFTGVESSLRDVDDSGNTVIAGQFIDQPEGPDRRQLLVLFEGSRQLVMSPGFLCNESSFNSWYGLGFGEILT
ncbi:unnamed protein product [Linum trigynum]|uniref:Uncharacterized protein n=1 Tax=Linum trigynum TaxID=586398 RepID=A0AAV2ERL0_9ROSI